MEIRTLAEGLAFPEGPVALADGSVVLVEIAAGTVTRVSPDGVKRLVARTGGGPNGAAIGPRLQFTYGLLPVGEAARASPPHLAPDHRRPWACRTHRDRTGPAE